MKKLALIVLSGLLIFSVFSFIGYSQISGKLDTAKKSVWTITSFTSDPSCYKPVLVTPTHAPMPTMCKLRIEFKATKSLIPPGDLILTGKLVSNLDTGAKPPINLSAICAGWADGTTNSFMWDGDKFMLTKVNSKYYVVVYDGLKIKPGTTGDVKIFITAESKDGHGVYNTDKKILTIKPCIIIKN